MIDYERHQRKLKSRNPKNKKETNSQSPNIFINAKNNNNNYKTQAENFSSRAQLISRSTNFSDETKPGHQRMNSFHTHRDLPQNALKSFHR